MVARQPQPVQGGYAISKGAADRHPVLAYELGPSGVRVNAVVPGWMAGPSVDIYIQMTSDGSGGPQAGGYRRAQRPGAAGPDPERRGCGRVGGLPGLGPVVGHDRPGHRHQRWRDLHLISGENLVGLEGRDDVVLRKSLADE